ncbi:MAG: hypothetical protein U1E78_11530 [Gammaproteobacteria bacterium]
MKTLNLHEIKRIAGGAINKAKLKADMLKAHQERMKMVNEKHAAQREAAYQHLEVVKTKMKEAVSPANLAKKAWESMWS